MNSLYALITRHGLRKGQRIRHDRGRVYTYSHFREARPQPRPDALMVRDEGKHIGIDEDGNPTGLTEGVFWELEQAQ